MKEPNNTPQTRLKIAPKSIKPIPLGDLPFSFLNSLEYIDADINTGIEIIPIIIFRLIEIKLFIILNKTKIAENIIHIFFFVHYFTPLQVNYKAF